MAEGLPDIEIVAAERLRTVDAPAVAIDAEDQKALIYEKTRDSALADSLTGLSNSRAIHMFLEQRLAECQRHEGSDLLVLCIDVDDFAAFNESYGYGMGDRLISEVGTVIRKNLLQADMLARYGGDEFVALLPATSPASSSVLRERIRNAADSYHFLIPPQEEFSVSLSIGVASFPADGDTADQILLAANLDMKRNRAACKRSTSSSKGRDLVRLGSFR